MKDDQSSTGVNDQVPQTQEDQSIQGQQVLSTQDSETTNVVLRRLDDYLRESLAEPSAQVAALGMVSHMLLRMAVRLHEQIENVLGNVDDPVENFEVLARAVDSVLRVCRQIERFGQLRVLLTDASRALNPPSVR